MVRRKGVVMNKFAEVLFFVLVSLTLATAAEVPGVPANGTWVRLQDGVEMTQWIAVSATQPWTRIDLISTIDDGARSTYYLVRTACSADRFAVAVIKHGNDVGIGKDCDGALVPTYATVLTRVQALPAEALAMLKP